jgi:sugar/nucleoside kinase (ribokinase family)
MSTEVVVAGHVCLDIIPELPAGVKIDPGALVNVGTAKISTGGPVSNTGISLHRLGVSVGLMGKVGDDPFGDIVRRVFRSVSPELDRAMAVVAGEQTSYSIVISPPGIDRTFLHFPGANDTFAPHDVDWTEVGKASHFHFGYPPLMAMMYANGGDALAQTLSMAQKMGVTTSLDTSLPDPNSASGKAPWRRILRASLPHCNWFLPSAEELHYMLHPQEFVSGSEIAFSRCIDLVREAVDLGASGVGLKMGERGFLLFDSTAGRWVFAPCFAVDVLGTTGSGDATIAGFLMGLVRQMNLGECALAGVAAGAACCEEKDSTSGIRPWGELKDRIEAGWPRLCVHSPSATVGTHAWQWIDEVWQIETK